MLEFRLDLTAVRNESDFQKLLISTFNLPDYYGENLDAFDECVAEFLIGASVRVSGMQKVPLDLRQYIERYISVLRDFQKQAGSNFHLLIE